MNALTAIAFGAYNADQSIPHWIGGFGSPLSFGAKASRRQVRGFFYALTVMVGGVWGGREACRSQSPVYQPDTSSTALSLVALVGGLKLLLWSLS